MYKKPKGPADDTSYKTTSHFNGRFWDTVDREDLPSLNVDPEINSNIKKNPFRSNVEIEKGEIVLNPDLTALFNARGKTHKGGGIDVLLRPGSFVFSNDKSLAFTEADHKLFEFKEGGNFKDKKNTPAEVLKRNVPLKHYNTLISNITDIKKDDLAKKSSTMMLEKYVDTLGHVAFLQESKKDFPDGIPEFSQGTAPVYHPEVKNEALSQKQYAKLGGNVQAWLGLALPVPYTKSKTPQGRRTPTGQSSYYNKDKDYLARWSPFIPDIEKLDNKQAQDAIYEFTMKNNPSKITSMWDTYGITNEGRKHKDLMGMTTNGVFKPNSLDEKALRELKRAYVDGMFGARQLEPDQPKIQPREPGKMRMTITQAPTPELEAPKPGTADGAVDMGKNIDWDFNRWQRISQGYNLGKLATAKRYMPYRSHMNPSFIDPALVNPEQAIGDVQGQTNQSVRALTSLNPIMRNAQASAYAGQVMDKIPGIRSQYDNQNAGILNQTRGINNQTANQARMTNMNADQQYYQQTITGQANFDNMRNYLGDQYMNNLMTDVQDNQSLAYNLATLNNPAYGYNFKTGNYYRNPKNILDVATTQRTQEDLIAQAEDLRNRGFSDQLVGAIIKSKTYQTAKMAPKRLGGRVGNPYK